MFEIEVSTPFKPKTAIDCMTGWMADEVNFGTDDPGPPAQRVQSYAHLIMGSFSPDRGDKRCPKTTRSHRKNLMFQWGFLKCLAEENPGLFDEVLVAYVERWYLTN